MIEIEKKDPGSALLFYPDPYLPFPSIHKGLCFVLESHAVFQLNLPQLSAAVVEALNHGRNLSRVQAGLPTIEGSPVLCKGLETSTGDSSLSNNPNFLHLERTELPRELFLSSNVLCFLGRQPFLPLVQKGLSSRNFCSIRFIAEPGLCNFLFIDNEINVSYK